MDLVPALSSGSGPALTLGPDDRKPMTMSSDRHYVPVARPVSERTRTEALYRAVAAARYAPSAYNTQPWRWRLSDDGLDLFVESSRMSDVGDPDGRLAAISCGAALHHARTALAAHGWRVTATRRPGDAGSGHVARLHIDAVAAIGRRAAHAAQTIRLRHTDPRPVTGEPLRPEDLNAVSSAAESEGSRLHVLRPDEILRLVVATSHADNVGPVEAQWYDELARWAGRDRIVGGVNDMRPSRQEVGPDRAATFAVFYGPADEPLDWLRAGEALSAAWLVATGLRISVLPFSAPIEQAPAREALRRTLGDLGNPYLVVRLGRHPGPAVEPRSPRLPVDQIIENPVAGTA
jgi:nitroreductase